MPSSEIFHLFDDVIFMCQGRVVYQGPLRCIKGHFAALQQPCPDGYNIADHVMETMQTLPPEQITWMQDEFAKHGIMGRSTAMHDNIGSGEEATAIPDVSSSTIDDEFVPLMKPCVARTVSFEQLPPKAELYQPTPKRSIFFQCGPLILREWRNLYRDRNALILVVTVTTLLYTALGIIFWQRGDTNRVDYDPKSHFGAIMMAMVGFMFSNINPVMLAFPSQRPVFMREYAAGLYSTIPYVLARFLVDAIVTLTMSCFAWLIAYWMMGLNGNFFFFWCIMFLLGMSASSMGLVLGSCVSTGRKALLLSPLILVPNILFAGFYLPIDQIQEWIRWMQYLCFLGYNVKLLVLVEFDSVADVKDKVKDIQQALTVSDFTNTPGSDTSQQEARQMIAALRDSISPVQATNAIPEDWWIYLIIISAIIIGFRLVTAVILAYKGKQSVQ